MHVKFLQLHVLRVSKIQLYAIMKRTHIIGIILLQEITNKLSFNCNITITSVDPVCNSFILLFEVHYTEPAWNRMVGCSRYVVSSTRFLFGTLLSRSGSSVSRTQNTYSVLTQTTQLQRDLGQRTLGHRSGRIHIYRQYLRKRMLVSLCLNNSSFFAAGNDVARAHEMQMYFGEYIFFKDELGRCFKIIYKSSIAGLVSTYHPSSQYLMLMKKLSIQSNFLGVNMSML